MQRPILTLGLLAATCACAPVPGLVPFGPGAQSAQFATYPTSLLTAALQACSAPGQTARRPDRDTIVCETLPTPEAAAALILAHNGTVLDLPSYIIGFQANSADSGYVVTADNYIRVPQEGGGVAQIRLRDAAVEQTMRDLLGAAGGLAVAP